MEGPGTPSAAATRADRAHGCLLLSACGDALGARFEGAALVDPLTLDGWLAARDTPLRWTDDTAMTLVLAEHLRQRGGAVDEDALATDFAAQWARAPDRGYSPSTARVLAAIAGGTPWPVAAGRLFDGTGSLGNGAAMRVAPVGLVPGLDLPAVAGRARRTAAVTHAHRLGQDGAAVQAVAVAVAARTSPSAPVDPDDLLVRVAGQAATGEFREALHRVAALTRRGAGPTEVATRVGNDASALAAVPAALAAFLSHPDDPVAAIRFAIRLGGDTDTIAAMTGALAGARLGAGAVPPHWARRTEAADRITALAAALVGRPS